MRSRIRKWWLRNIHDVGKKVYWNNPVDSRYTGEYVITTKRDKNGYVGIYNEEVGNRTVPYYYLNPYRRWEDD